MSATSDPRKGFKELKEAFRFLKRNDIELIVFGSGEPKRVPDFGFRVHYVGKLQDEVSLVTLYSAADVMVVPSLQENLSNAIMESLACGTPVVAFDIGGNRDMIEHEGNGYLARPYDVEDLARGIEWVLAYPEYEKLCQHARAKVEKEFSSEIVARKYVALYQKILGNGK
jgi:glycosyltransferase involved in cell wall biosynthesis